MSEMTEEQIEAWRRAIREHTFGNYYYEMGIAIEREGNLPVAIDSYRRAVEARPHYPEALVRLEQALRAAGRSDEAEELVARSHAADPGYRAEAEFNMGCTAFERCQYDEASRHLESALAMRPEWPLAYAYAGLSALAAGRSDAARDCLARMGQLPAARIEDVAAELTELGKRLQSEGRLDDAILALETAVQLRPDDADANFYIAIALKLARRLEDSIPYYARAAELRPGAAELGHLAMTQQAAGKFDEALSSFRRAIELDPKIDWLHSNLGLALRLAGQTDEALEAVDRAIGLAPTARNIAYRGMVLEQAGRRPEAAAEYKRALELDSSAPMNWVHDRLAAVSG